MSSKLILLIGLIFLMTLALISACQPGEAPVGAPPPTELPAVTSPPAQTANLENPALKAKLEAGEPLRIMNLGESIVDGWCDRPSQCIWPAESFPTPTKNGLAACSWTGNTANPKAAGYRGFLLDKLTAEGVNTTYVGSVEVVQGLAHEGHAGFTIEDLDYCVQNAGWLENAKPDMILLLVGGVDARWAGTAQSMTEGLEKLLESIYERIPETTEVIVAQNPPQRQGLHKQEDTSTILVNDVLVEYNAGIPKLVEKLQEDGKRISTVDMWDLVHSDDELSEPGTVPRAIVGERMAQEWLEKIMEILGKPVLVSASPTLQLTPTEGPTPPPKYYVDAPLRIMPMGDAIIEGWCDRSNNCVYPEGMKIPRDGYGVEACSSNINAANPGAKGFREFLRDKLVAAGVNMSYVGSVEVIPGLAHEGHTGFNIADLEYCIQNAKWLEQAAPDMILLLTGGSDLFNNSPPEKVIEELEGLMTNIYQILPETTEVIVAQLPPVRDDAYVGLDASLPLFNEPIAGYNAGIPGVVDEFRANGKHVSYVDLQNTIQTPDDNNELGILPTLVASERMAQVWFEKIMEIIEQQD